MARGPRLRIPGATFHVMNRGNHKATIFEDDRDRRRFLQLVTEAAKRYDVTVHGDCMMGSHFHQVVTTLNDNLSEFMKHIEGCFAQYSNWRHDREGHLFQGPFKAILIEHDVHLFVALGYVLINPVEAGLVSHPQEWRWSSYRATAGLTQVPPHLSIDWLDWVFPAATRQDSQRLFRKVFDDGYTPAEWLETPALGSEQFRKSIRSFIGENLHQASLPRAYRALFRPSLDELFSPSVAKTDRATVMQRAHVIHGYTMAEIARALRLHPASVSRIICKLRHDGEKRLKNVENWDLTPYSTVSGSGRGKGRRRESFRPRRRRIRG